MGAHHIRRTTKNHNIFKYLRKTSQRKKLNRSYWSTIKERLNLNKESSEGFTSSLSISQVFIHELYNPINLDYDIAILRLSEKIPMNSEVSFF